MTTIADKNVQFTVEVVYALAERQVVLQVVCNSGQTARELALSSGIDAYFDSLDTATVSLGVFGESVSDDYVLEPGDRLELYRELLLDPMEQRRQRARKDIQG